MELKEILAISGQPGLYKYVAQSTNGVIVESLLDGKRMNASASSKVSALTEISIFTEGDDLPLTDVFTNIYNHTGGKEAISHKEAPEKLKAAFAEVLPDYDRDRVHVSGHEEGLHVVQHPARRGIHRIQTARDGGGISPPCSQSVPAVRCDAGGFLLSKCKIRGRPFCRFVFCIIFVSGCDAPMPDSPVLSGREGAEPRYRNVCRKRRFPQAGNPSERGKR